MSEHPNAPVVVGHDSLNDPLRLALNIPLHKFVKTISTPERSEPGFTRLTRPLLVVESTSNSLPQVAAMAKDSPNAATEGSRPVTPRGIC
jgi:hypothetical protein